MVKKGTVKRLLGLRGESLFWKIYFKIVKHLTFMRVLAGTILILLIIALVLFANLEIIPRPEFQDFTRGMTANPYFLSAYWVVTTLTTVGYGEITPTSTGGILVAMLVMLLGVTFMSIIISQLTSMIVAANLSSMFGINRARKRIDLIICGWNATTEATLQELKKMEVVIVDKKNVSEAVKAYGAMFVMGDPTKPEILENANIKHAKSLVLALDNDSEVLLATHVIRELNPYINLIVKINNHEHVELAERAGADHVVSPSSIGGRLLSIVADEPHVVEWVVEATTTKKGISLVEYDIGKESPYVNKTIGEIRDIMGERAKILGVETSSGFERIPNDRIKIEQGTKIIAIARK